MRIRSNRQSRTDQGWSTCVGLYPKTFYDARKYDGSPARCDPDHKPESVGDMRSGEESWRSQAIMCSRRPQTLVQHQDAASEDALYTTNNRCTSLLQSLSRNAPQELRITGVALAHSGVLQPPTVTSSILAEVTASVMLGRRRLKSSLRLRSRFTLVFQLTADWGACILPLGSTVSSVSVVKDVRPGLFSRGGCLFFWTSVAVALRGLFSTGLVYKEEWGDHDTIVQGC